MAKPNPNRKSFEAILEKVARAHEHLSWQKCECGGSFQMLAQYAHTDEATGEIYDSMDCFCYDCKSGLNVVFDTDGRMVEATPSDVTPEKLDAWEIEMARKCLSGDVLEMFLKRMGKE